MNCSYTRTLACCNGWLATLNEMQCDIEVRGSAVRICVGVFVVASVICCTQRPETIDSCAGESREGLTKSVAQPAVDIGDEIQEDVRQGIVGQYGYGVCDPRWMEALITVPYDAIFLAQVIANDGCTELGPKIVEALMNENPYVRSAAAWLVKELVITEAIDQVGELVDDREYIVANQALETVCELSVESCDEMVRRRMRSDRPWEVRNRAIRYARERHIGLSTKELLELIDDEHEAIIVEGLRSISCEVMGGDERILKRTLSMLRESERWDSAVWKLAVCPIEDAREDVFRLFVSKVEDIGDTDVFGILIDAITAYDGPEATTMLEEYVIRHESDQHTRGIGASNVVAPLERAVRGLGSIGGEASRDALVHALGDPYYRVRLASIESLMKLGLQCDLVTRLGEMAKYDAVDIVRVRSGDAISSCQ